MSLMGACYENVCHVCGVAFHSQTLASPPICSIYCAFVWTDLGHEEDG